MSWVRLLAVGLIFHVKTIMRSSFFVAITVVTPTILATLAFYMYRRGSQPESMLYAAIGTGLMGVWATTLFGSGGALQFNRFLGTLEILFVTPTPFLLVLAPITIATSLFGMLSLLVTVVWGRLLFDVHITVEHPVLLVAAVPVTVFSIGMLGLVLAAVLVLYRHANALANLLSTPVWLVTGVLVPVSLLPAWVEPISWVLAPTWGVRAIRESTLGGEPAFALAMCLVLAGAYLALAALFVGHLERLARVRATLSLT